jgi:hypothetical protein
MPVVAPLDDNVTYGRPRDRRNVAVAVIVSGPETKAPNGRVDATLFEWRADKIRKPTNSGAMLAYFKYISWKLTIHEKTSRAEVPDGAAKSRISTLMRSNRASDKR